VLLMFSSLRGVFSFFLITRPLSLRCAKFDQSLMVPKPTAKQRRRKQVVRSATLPESRHKRQKFEDSPPVASSEAESEAEYKVEAIVDEKADGSVLVKWVGWEEATWEPKQSIPAHFIDKFRKAAKFNASDASARKPAPKSNSKKSNSNEYQVESVIDERPDGRLLV